MTIVAHQNNGAFKFEQNFFQQFEGFEIEIVGRLVENQYIGRSCEQASEDRPVDFASGQGFHGCADTIWRKQKVT